MAQQLYTLSEGVASADGIETPVLRSITDFAPRSLVQSRLDPLGERHASVRCGTFVAVFVGWLNTHSDSTCLRDIALWRASSRGGQFFHARNVLTKVREVNDWLLIILFMLVQ